MDESMLTGESLRTLPALAIFALLMWQLIRMRTDERKSENEAWRKLVMDIIEKVQPARGD